MSHDHPTDPARAPEEGRSEAPEASVGRRRFVRMGLLGLGGVAAALMAPQSAAAHPHGRGRRRDYDYDYDDHGYDEWDDWHRRRRGRRRRHRSHRVRSHRDVGYYCKPCGLRCRSYDHLASHVHKVHRIAWWRLMHVLVFGRGGWYFYG